MSEKMKTFNIHMTLKRDKKDSEFDNINQVKSEIITWLEDLGFFVSFDDDSNYQGLLDYEGKCQSILWEYIPEKDIPKIQKEIARRLGR